MVNGQHGQLIWKLTMINPMRIQQVIKTREGIISIVPSGIDKIRAVVQEESSLYLYERRVIETSLQETVLHKYDRLNKSDTCWRGEVPIGLGRTGRIRTDGQPGQGGTLETVQVGAGRCRCRGTMMRTIERGRGGRRIERTEAWTTAQRESCWKWKFC